MRQNFKIMSEFNDVYNCSKMILTIYLNCYLCHTINIFLEFIAFKNFISPPKKRHQLSKRVSNLDFLRLFFSKLSKWDNFWENSYQPYIITRWMHLNQIMSVAKLLCWRQRIASKLVCSSKSIKAFLFLDRPKKWISQQR